MKLSLQTLASFLTLTSVLVLAAPKVPGFAGPPLSTLNLDTNPTITPPNRYYLQTRVNGNGTTDKDGLYVSTLHIGAGQNVATLVPYIDVAKKAFLNNSMQLFDFGNDEPWIMTLANYDLYAGMSPPSLNNVCLQRARALMLMRFAFLEWSFVAVNGGHGSSGFFFNESGLQSDGSMGVFTGWLGKSWMSPLRPSRNSSTSVFALWLTWVCSL